MKMLMFSGPNSNSGKTLVTSAVLRSLKNRGLDIAGFKSGPDFVDRYFLRVASQRRAGNLDPFLMGKEGMDMALSLAKTDYALVEGVMGYYDGMSNGWEGSSFDIARTYSIPTVIIYSPKGEMFTAITKLKGMVDFSGGLIRGVIFNKCSEKMYDMLAEKLEEYTEVKALGFIPMDKSLAVEADRLGLRLSEESQLDDFLERAGNLVERTLDMEGLVGLFNDVQTPKRGPLKGRGIKIAVAYDEAFASLYTENLSLFEELGHVEFFSPLKDKALPKCDLLYLPTGYQVEFAEELSRNLSMLKSIKDYIESGGYCLAEGGGFEYLNKKLNGFTMAGLFEGEVLKTDRLNNFGYHSLKLEGSILGTCQINVHEYHKSEILGPGPALGEAIKNGKSRPAGFQYKNTLGLEQIINFAGAKDALEYLVDNKSFR